MLSMLIPGQGTKVMQSTWWSQKKKQPQNTQKINKLHDFFRISDEDNFMTQTNARVHAYFIVQCIKELNHSLGHKTRPEKIKIPINTIALSSFVTSAYPAPCS